MTYRQDQEPEVIPSDEGKSNKIFLILLLALIVFLVVAFIIIVFDIGGVHRDQIIPLLLAPYYLG